MPGLSGLEKNSCCKTVTEKQQMMNHPLVVTNFDYLASQPAILSASQPASHSFS